MDIFVNTAAESIFGPAAKKAQSFMDKIFDDFVLSLLVGNRDETTFSVRLF